MVLEQVFGQRKDFLQRGVAVLSGEPVEVRVGDADGAEVAADALRKREAGGLHIVFICVALVSFNPWCNMWLAVAPEFFSLSENPWYYLMGVVCMFFAVRGLLVYNKLPEKEKAA